MMLCLLAAEPLLRAEVLSFRSYTVQDGLPQSRVYALLEDRRGYLWIGTGGGGVSRFDGFEFETFNERDGMSDGNVYSIIEDRLGRLWLGTAFGVTVIEGTELRSLKAEQGLVDEAVWSLTEDQHGAIWLATLGAGLVRYAEGELTRYIEGLPDTEVRHVSSDGHGRIWGATPHGAFVFENEQITVFTREDGLPSDDVRVTAEDAAGARWFATAEGVASYHNQVWQTYTTADGLVDNRVWFILPEPDGTVWFTTENGVSRIDGASFSSWTTRQGLPNQVVESMLRDSDGNLWLGTGGTGLARFIGYHIRSIRTSDGLPDPGVWSLLWDQSGFTWIATDAGLVRYDPVQDQVSAAIYGSVGKQVNYVAYDRNENLWFGAGSRLFRSDGSDGHRYLDLTAMLDLPENAVLSIAQDRRGQVWIGTSEGGVLVISEDRLQAAYGREDGLLASTVNSILEDRRGQIWLATDRGVNLFRGETLEPVNALPVSAFMTIAEDRAGYLWFGTYGDGVIGYNPESGSTVSLTSRDGLIDDTVTSLLLDAEERLWISTNRGVAYLDTAQYHRDQSYKLKSYGYHDGLEAIECNHGRMTVDDKGRVWVGTIGGAYIIDPGEERIDKREANAYITDVLLFLESIDSSKLGTTIDRSSGLPLDLTLPASQNHLTFEFTGICLTAPERVRFQLMLEGFEQHWSPVTTQRQVNYANLPPGDFTFKVKAGTAEGRWNREPARYSFTILAPWWRAWWFLLLALLVGSSVIIGGYQLRMRSLRHYQHTLEREISNRTRELHQEKLKVEQINTELEDRVRERTEKLEATSEKLVRAKKMEAIGQLAGGVAHDLNNILAGVVSYPDLLLFRLPPDSPSRDYLLNIKRSGEKAAAIVQDLLTLARRGVSDESVINLNSTIEEYLASPEHLRLMNEFPEVEIEHRLDPDLANIKANPLHLAKSLMNLVINGFEAIPQGGGRVSITTRTEELSSPLNGYPDVVPGHYVILEVSDTGVGIPAEDLEHIFEPFYSKKKLDRSGTGLGMTVVWGTVADHNGYISIDSSESSGTAFTLYFPACAESQQEPAVEDSEDLPLGRGEQILLVDDLLEQRALGSTMLEQLGYQVETVASGEEAVTCIRRQGYDLVVLDMIMEPGMDGLDTCCLIRQIRPQQRAIIVSGYSETSRVLEAMKLGVSGYVQKPYSLSSISRAIHRALRADEG
jgi:ligand-binding sensor domain-containing protein/signal transduction histidine kinase/CheY-like chemotaxis protein